MFNDEPGIDVALEEHPVLSLIGGIFLIYFAFTQLISLRKSGINVSEGRRNAFLAGIVLTAFNPYFIVWWLTVGTKLGMDSMQLSPSGVLLMYILHVWTSHGSYS